MKKIYLDNAATTPMAPEVVDAMCDVLRNHFGNPSSTHSFGRSAKSIIETSRKTIAKYLNCSAQEIIFTSGGTEADNLIIHNAVFNLGVRRIVTSKIEHHAVLHMCTHLENTDKVTVDYVAVDEFGGVNLSHLEELLSISNTKTLVSLMHINNEIGTILEVEKVSQICKRTNALFHSDTVQTMAHYKFDLQNLPVDFVTCSAHKFHGPKGVGFLYKNKSLRIRPIVTGGGQESSMRAGTENVTGIAGLAKALEVAYRNIDVKIETVYRLKAYFMEQLLTQIPGVCFNGDTSKKGGLYTVLNVSLPPTDNASTLLFQLDMNGICASGGSACNSGAVNESHVLNGIKHPADRSAVRFSFSKFTTKEEIDFTISTLKELL